MMQGFEKAAVLAGETTERMRLDVEHARALTRDCDVLPFSEEAAAIAAYIFPRLSQSQRNKHWTDVFIVATALAHEYGVATRNRNDFELIASHTPQHYAALRLQIWK
jgi:predicted nucleic acid-binding protein